MKNYIIKRITVLFVTLFGITLITFIITRIAPGDPATLKLQSSLTSPKAQPITKKMIEENRKLYGFDKPLILNFKSKGLPYSVLSLLNEFINEEEGYFKDRVFEKIRNLNTIAVPYIIEFLKKNNVNDNDKERLIKLILEALEIKEFSQDIFKIEKYYESIKEDFQKSKIESYLKKYYETGILDKNKVLSAKSASIPLLVEYLFKEKNRDRAGEFINLLGVITGKPWVYNPDMSKREFDNTIYSIKKFWEYEKEYYVEFSFFEKFLRVFSDTQFGIWVYKVIRLDFDISYAYNIPVTTLIKERIGPTIELNIISMVIIYLLALFIGIRSSLIHNTRKERIISLILFILYSLPSFWVANLLIMFFTGSDSLNIFPASYLHSPDADKLSFFGYILDHIWHLFLPVFVLTYGSLAYLSRQMKMSMLDVLSADYIRTAIAKGLSEKDVIYKHALRNALIPIITLLGGVLPAMLSGSIIIEEIFSINGMGKLSFEAVMNRDYPVINALALISSFLTLIGILISDILYYIVDPRIKFEKVE
ncbi:MAG TPA: ABC transporter permease [Spirochaetota bacterium]|nr:ABC transporter permease [Spirochaetota bacterium]HOM37600.1 ABC transporter permease [Spirochaetota bacterium]HPQ49429.1 ABC transporter permease [Spirochaetota bacterium]